MSEPVCSRCRKAPIGGVVVGDDLLCPVCIVAEIGWLRTENTRLKSQWLSDVAEIERLRAENTRLKSQWLSDADLEKIARRMAEVAMDKIGEAYNASMCATTAYLLGDTAAQKAGGKDE